MTVSEAQELTTIDQLDVIVDSDAHTIESLDHMLPYMEDEASKKMISDIDDPLSRLYSFVISGDSTDYYSTDEGITASKDEDLIEKKLGEMDDFGIDYGLSAPGLNLFLATVNNDRYAAALAQAYNSWIVDSIVDETDRILPSIVVAGQVPHKAAEEIDRWGDEDIAGVHIPIAGLAPPLGHEKYDPIYEAASRYDLPIFLHPAPDVFNFPVQHKHIQTHPEWMVTQFPFLVIWQFVSLIYSGVPERFPDLKFIMQEAGIGWVPYIKFRMDDNYLIEGDRVPHLEKLPSEYIPGRFFFTTQPLGHTAHDPQNIAQLVEMAGPETIVYSSDLPHHDFDPPEEVFDRINGYLDEEDVRGVMGENMAHVFDI